MSTIKRGHSEVNKSLTVSPNSDGKRRHRAYSPEFKRELVEASFKPDVSVAAIAMSNGINPNLLHNWRAQFLRGRGRWLSTASMVPVVVTDAVEQPQSRAPAPTDKAHEGELEIDVDLKKTRIIGPLNREILQMALECLR